LLMLYAKVEIKIKIHLGSESNVVADFMRNT
jgi:hypothetical protein